MGTLSKFRRESVYLSTKERETHFVVLSPGEILREFR